MAGTKKPHAQQGVSERVARFVEDNKAASAPNQWETFNHSEPTRLLRRPEVEARTGLSRSTLYDWMKRGEFPQPVKLGERLVAWRDSDIAAWLESRETRGAA